MTKNAALQSLLRTKLQSYKHQRLPKRKSIANELDEVIEEVCSYPANKKFRKADSSYEKLLDPVKNFNLQVSDEEDEYTSYSSNSYGAVLDETPEPVADFTKLLLRQNYLKKNVNKVEMDAGGKVEKNVVELGRGDNAVKGCSNSGEEGETEGNKEAAGVKFKDLGGMKELLLELRWDVLVPLFNPELPHHLGIRPTSAIKPTSGILLHGAPGCGKTTLAHAIANEAAVPFYKISATEVVSSISGAAEENIRELFSKARRTAPSIVFIDEIDAIASKRENLQRELERRIVTQLMTCMDESYQLLESADAEANLGISSKRSGYVLVIGATNRPDAIDPALRRPGRFDREIMIGIPDENARAQILSVITSDLTLEGSFDFLKVARLTAGFVGADLTALASKAGSLAWKRFICEQESKLCVDPGNCEQSEVWPIRLKHTYSAEDMKELNITMSDFEEAAKFVQPSLRREGFSAIPNVKWEDIGGLDSLREEFKHFIVRRISHPEDDKEFGVDLEQGFLLYGPPGCGKTLIAKAVANEARANFIHIKGPEILSKYVGDSELAVRTIFTRARMCSPCILFLDEMDALTTRRGSEDGRKVLDSLLNQLLIELDGADNRKGVFVIGATNRPEVIDPALLRPRRFGKLVYVPLPGPDERGSILKALARSKPIDAEVNLYAIARRENCKNLSGADLYKLINEAADAAKIEKQKRLLNNSENLPSTIKMKHFEQALGKITPSVSKEEIEEYDVLSRRFRKL